MKAIRALLILCTAVTLSAGVALAQDGAAPGFNGPGRWGPGRGEQFDGRGGPGMRGRHRHDMRMRQRMHRMRDPVATLLEHQTALHLSVVQVNNIIAIDNKLHADNKPLVERLMAMRPGMRRGGPRQEGGAGAGVGPTGPSAAQRDSAMSIMQTIRENSWRATAAANAVLTADQLNTAGNFDRAARPAWRMGPPGANRGPGAPKG